MNAVAGLTVAIAQTVMVMFVDLPPALRTSANSVLVVCLIASAVVTACSGLVAVVAPSSLHGAFATQALAVACGSSALLIWAASIAVVGTPLGVGFSWSPGLLSIATAYSVYLLRRSFLESRLERSQRVFYAHLWAAVAVLPIDVAVLVRVIIDFVMRAQD